jgi:hypothetical protein
MIGAVANRLLRESPVPVVLIGKEPYAPVPDHPRQQGVSKRNEAMIQPDTLLY